MHKFDEQLDQPINMDTRYLYGINIRLDAVIEQLSALSEYIAKRDGIATTNQEVKIDVSQVIKEEASKALQVEVETARRQRKK